MRRRRYHRQGPGNGGRYRRRRGGGRHRLFGGLGRSLARHRDPHWDGGFGRRVQRGRDPPLRRRQGVVGVEQGRAGQGRKVFLAGGQEEGGRWEGGGVAMGDGRLFAPGEGGRGGEGAGEGGGRGQDGDGGAEGGGGRVGHHGSLLPAPFPPATEYENQRCINVKKITLVQINHRLKNNNWLSVVKKEFYIYG